jgi:hypothetical protein
MAFELLKAALGIAVIFGLWLLVQRAWLATTPGRSAADDALAGRTGCHDCTCGNPGGDHCENNSSTRNAAQNPN